MMPLRTKRPLAVGAPDALRVCHVMTADMWAGAETQVATVASYLVERPDVILTAVLLNEGWLARELRRLGVEMAVIDERRHTSVQIVRTLTRFLREHDVQVIHTHRCKDTVLGAAAAGLAGVPHLIRTVHGLAEPMRGWDLAKFRVYDALDKAALWLSADRILAVSRQMADTLKGSGYRADSVNHLHNGIDLGRVRPTRARGEVRRDLGLDDEAIVIGTAGRLSRVKGHEFLVKAARSIRRREPGARFMFVGNGPLKGELLASAAELGVDEACLFVDPAVDGRSGVYDLIAAMDVFALPSLAEGIPMALLEAMALGRPVVASAVGGVPEIVIDRATGLLVESRNADALAAACLELMRNGQWAQTVGARGRRLVEKEFSRDKHGQGLLQAYRDIVGNGATTRGETATAPAFVRRAAPGRILESVRQKLRHTAERTRVRRQRKRPAALVAALRSAKTLLIVCHGNIIRSAFAARLLILAFDGRPPLAIRSAGLEAIPGRASHPTAVRIAGPFGIDLNDHQATRVTSEIVASADVILVMDVIQLALIKARFPEARTKAFLFAGLAPNELLEVADPVLGNEAVFQSCFEHIRRAGQPLIRILSDRDQ